MLKDFRSIDVYWDKATRRIYEEIRSSSSDEKGRKLTVQIVNDGQIQDLTNVALNLYWETQDGENRGLDPFTALDPENGIYELYFRTGMLEHVGKLNAHLHLVDTTGAITSEPFTIVVFQGVDVDAMASDDELSALNQALIEVQNIKQDIAELAGLIADHNHDTKYLGKTAKAADSDKLDGYDQSGENVPSTIVRRTSYGTVHASTLTEDGIPLQDKYLGKTAKAADSAKLDGREVSWEPVAGGIPRWSSPEKAIKADEFREKDVKLENKYLQTTAPRPPTYNLNSLMDPGIYSSQTTPFSNYPTGSAFSGQYGTVIVLRREGSSGRNQIYLDSNGNIFSRYGTSTNFGSWTMVTGAL